MIEMSEWGKKYPKFVFKSDNQKVMSRNVFIFGIQINHNNQILLYECFKNLHFQFSLLNSPGQASQYNLQS